jgi:fructose-1,6-bisphosphatase/inositol monophosphatase family enzyme
MIRIDPQQVADIIREAAVEEILPRFGNLKPGEIREKEPGQLVTEADTEAEKVLARRLLDLLPGASIVGEESVQAHPGLMNALGQPGAVWIIDPVDGTANFTRGMKRFGVIVALVVDGITVAGWIHDPIPNRTIIAEAGQGAWMGDRRLSVLAEAPLEQMRGSARRRPLLSSRVAAAGTKGSAAHDYLDLVTEHLHFAHFGRLMPWDHAAGVLIHSEAGGFSAMLNGVAYRPVPTDKALLLAPSRAGWDLLRPLVA